MPILQQNGTMMDNAVCVAVTIGRLGNSRKISSSQVEVDADKDLIRVGKTLLDSPELRDVQSFDGQIRQMLYGL
jgi:hypothetical protein